MIIAFYKVDNSQGYERHTFDDIYDQPEKIKEMLSKLSGEELKMYDTNNYGWGAVPSPNLADFVEDFNDQELDSEFGDSWWCVVIQEKKEN